MVAATLADQFEAEFKNEEYDFMKPPKGGKK